MRNRKNIFNRCISALMLIIYLFGSLSFLSVHNHHDGKHDHDHDDHEELLFCENTYLNVSSNLDCSHNSHLTVSKENCSVCDHFSNLNLAILKNRIDFNFKLFSLNIDKYSTSVHVIDLANTLNKSPPFII